MKIAIAAQKPLDRLPVEGADTITFQQLEETELARYEAVLLIGDDSLDRETALSREQSEALWRYVRGGGKLYAELIAAFDFPSSRLFGWKQDFPKSRRTLEKLRATEAAESGLRAGSLLEWEGAMAYGFAVNSEVWLEFGAFQETYASPPGQTTVRTHPALTVRELGEGLAVYAAFPLFGGADAAPLRPYGRWAALIDALSSRTGIPFRVWPAAMAPSGGDSPEQAVRRAASWFVRSGMLPRSDGSQGVFENIHSVTGRLSPDLRPDCHAHAALMYYLLGKWSGDASYEEISHGLLQSLFDGGYQDMDPYSASYGLFKWYQFPEEKPDQMFTDDNSWVCLALLYLYRRTGREEYRRRGLLVAEALLETQHPNGLRSKVLEAGLRETGRARAASELDVSWNPHFESIAHAAFIQAYLVTGRQVYLDTAIRGTLTLLDHPERLQFMYSRTSGLSRLLLPLPYLAKHDPSGRIRRGLEETADYLLAHQHASGAVEEADNPDPERFGLEDAGVFIRNGEGIADQLYTNNFLLMNVWEAWKHTGERRYEQWYRELASFLCRIQIASDDPRYDGGWMRAFSLPLDEYFGNNGDTGWGPYCMESGWTNALIPFGLLLGLTGDSIFE
ncbi:hypothetical protein ACFQWB_02645 [Paenibacillus thermoaerophilus]|uniref:Uncharacterized protein n=1 Tax=Paenibacillus thermoaerophilus TaxID=1215385 RepID=A0ABW2UYA7_9BACL|nr:hypothetical protein [Paenibacillus thermoaerophilus]TMV17781.1 hypothetical protein FE781_06550 [Paenibacillus thermoaerophilus]